MGFFYYNLNNSYHAVKVFEFPKKNDYGNNSDVEELVSFGCNSCKFHKKCENIKHKQDNCFVASDFEKILADKCNGRTSAFYCDCFYINIKPKHVHLIINMLKKNLKEKYQR